MAGYAGAWHGHGSFHDREPASFGGARLGGGVLVGLDGAHAHGALGTLSQCPDRFIFAGACSLRRGV